MKVKKTIYEFENFRLTVAEQQFHHLNGELIPVIPKIFELLKILVENSNRWLTNQELWDNARVVPLSKRGI